MHLRVALCQVQCHLLSDLSLRWVLLNDVDLVSDDHNADVLLGLIAKTLDPILYVLKGGCACHIIHYESTDSVTVVSYCDRTVFLLTSRIPELSLHCGTVFEHHVFCTKFYTDRHGCRFGQSVVLVTLEKVSLANRDFPKDDDYRTHMCKGEVVPYFCKGGRGSNPFY